MKKIQYGVAGLLFGLLVFALVQVSPPAQAAQSPITTFNQYPGGINLAKNVTAAAVLKATPGTLRKIVVQAVGTGGTLTISDLSSTSGAAAANQLFTIGTAQLTVGQVITLDERTSTGIAVTTISGGIIVNISYD